MRPPTLQPQSKTHNLNRIIFLGLFSGILITTLIWLRIPNNFITPLSWLSLGLTGLGSFLYIRKTATNHSRWTMVLAALAAVSLVYLFPEMFRPVCGGMPRAFALNCPTECRIKECTKWVAGPSTECPNPGSGGGCCLSYTTTCDPDCNIEPVHDQPPTISGSVTCAQWGENGWCINNAILELTATEPQGKLLQISGDVGEIPFSCPTGNGSVNCSVPLTEGTVTVNYLATSITTLTASGSKTYKFDATSPQINGTLNGIPGANAWYISQVELDASALDPGAGSGMSTFEYNLDYTGWANYAGPLSLSDGVHNLDLRASDLAGNSVETHQTIQVDTINPALNLSINGKKGSNGWYTSNIQIDATASDAGSGVSSLEYDLDGIGWIPYSEILELSDGTHSLSLRLTDNAGNITEGTQNFTVDTLTPTIDFSVAGTQGTNGWYISDVQVSSSASDYGSGLSLLEVSVDGGAYSIYSKPLNFSDGQHSFQFHATDNAGNLAESLIQQVKVDTILPVIDLPKSWELGQTIIFKLQDDGSGLDSVRLVVEDEDERFPKVAWEKKLKNYKFKGEIDWDGRFKDGQLAPQGGEYYAWVKVSDAAGNERMQAGQIVVPITSLIEELFLPSGDQTHGLVSGIDASGTIEEQSVLQTSMNNKVEAPESLATNAPPPISFGGNSNGAAQPSDAQAGMTSFNAGGRSNSPIANSQSNLLWGATAAAAIGAFTAEAARRKAARRAANAAINQARKLKQQAYIYSQQLKKQKEAKAAIDALQRQAVYTRTLERKEEILGKELSDNLRKIQEREEELERAKQATYERFRAQEATAYKEVVPLKEKEKKSFLQVISDSLGSIGDPNRNPRSAEAHKQMWAGIGAWEAIFSMRNEAKEYTTQAIKDGRWSDAYRGVSTLAKQSLTVAAGTVAAAGIATWGAITTPIRIFTQDIPEFSHAGKERMECKDRFWDVLFTGSNLVGDVTALYGGYQAAGKLNLVNKINSIGTDYLEIGIVKRPYAFEGSEYVYRFNPYKRTALGYSEDIGKLPPNKYNYLNDVPKEIYDNTNIQFDLLVDIENSKIKPKYVSDPLINKKRVFSYVEYRYFEEIVTEPNAWTSNFRLLWKAFTNGLFTPFQRRK